MKRLPALLLITYLLLLPASADERKDTDQFKKKREQLVTKHIAGSGIKDKRVIDAMKRVPRHLFIPETLEHSAYDDRALPIGEGQTISQPYVVALMTESLGLKPGDRVLEIGTGSGYQAAVLSLLVKEVYSIEIKEKLHTRSKETLYRLGYSNVKTFRADGYFGLPDYAPFDCIMITAAVDHIPPPLYDQLAPGGRLILPLGHPLLYQNLVLIKKKSGKDYTMEEITGVLFVPMTGKAQE